MPAPNSTGSHRNQRSCSASSWRATAGEEPSRRRPRGCVTAGAERPSPGSAHLRHGPARPSSPRRPVLNSGRLRISSPAHGMCGGQGAKPPRRVQSCAGLALTCDFPSCGALRASSSGRHVRIGAHDHQNAPAVTQPDKHNDDEKSLVPGLAVGARPGDLRVTALRTLIRTRGATNTRSSENPEVSLPGQRLPPTPRPCGGLSISRQVRSESCRTGYGEVRPGTEVHARPKMVAAARPRVYPGRQPWALSA